MKIVVTESQLKSVIKELANGGNGNTAKDKLYSIATIAYSLWHSIGDDEDELEGWVKSKISDIDMNIRAVARGYDSDEIQDKVGVGDINTDDLIIGK